MNKLVLLVGPIASSKSTYCKNAAKQGFIICNDDDIVNLVHAHQYCLYNKKLKALYKTIENTVINSALLMGQSVIIDSGQNINLSRRKRFIGWAEALEIPCEAICFERERPFVHAQRRFLSDNRGFSLDWWLGVADRHEKKYVEPTLQEGLSAIHHITYQEILEGKVL